jgi:hypothetical protein
MTVPGLSPNQYRPFPAYSRFLEAGPEYQYRYEGAVPVLAGAGTAECALAKTPEPAS